MIEIKDIFKSFGGNQVLRGVDLTINKGETMVILGRSGCGKSVMLKLIMGLLKPDSGTIFVNGDEITSFKDNQFNTLRQKFGMLFQAAALFDSMTVDENVGLALREHTDLKEEDIVRKVKNKLKLVGLTGVEHLKPAELSGGMKKRAGLARAVVMDPEILFYDEPSSGLDPVSAAGIRQLVMDLAGKLGVTSVVVTHDMNFAFHVAGRMGMLDSGRMLKVGSRAEFEALRDGPPTGDKTADLIRQFIRGESEGPLTERKLTTAYETDILASAGLGVPRK